jgi:hypothetical protein
MPGLIDPFRPFCDKLPFDAENAVSLQAARRLRNP